MNPLFPANGDAQTYSVIVVSSSMSRMNCPEPFVSTIAHFFEVNS